MEEVTPLSRTRVFDVFILMACQWFLDFHANYFGGVAKTIAQGVVNVNKTTRDQWSAWHNTNYSCDPPLRVGYAMCQNA